MGFLEQILDETSELESPKSYWVWSGLAAVSAVSKHLSIDRGSAYTLYPNIYVLLVGKSANRKGPPVKMAKTLVNMVEATRVISGRNSIQAVLKKVAESKVFPSGRILTDASCFLVSDEMSNLIIKDEQAQTLLTQLYDAGYHEEKWENTTIYGNVTTLTKPYFVMLGATAQSHDEHVISERSVEGGYVGRMMCVYEDKRQRLNSLTENTEKKLNYTTLVDRLKQIMSLKGQFKTTKSARETYNDWYYPFNKKIESREIVDDTGTAGRMGDHVWKIAMLLSLCEKDDLVITHEDIEESLVLCTGSTTSVRRMTTGSKVTETGAKSMAVIFELMNQPDLTMSRNKLMQRLYMKLDKFDLVKVLETLSYCDIITEIHTPGLEPRIQLKEEVAVYFGQMKERGKI